MHTDTTYTCIYTILRFKRYIYYCFLHVRACSQWKRHVTIYLYVIYKTSDRASPVLKRTNKYIVACRFPCEQALKVILIDKSYISYQTWNKFILYVVSYIGESFRIPHMPYILHQPCIQNSQFLFLWESTIIRQSAHRTNCRATCKWHHKPPLH